MEGVVNVAGWDHCVELCCSALLLHLYQPNLFSGPLGGPLVPPMKVLSEFRPSPYLLHMLRGYCAAGALFLQPFAPPLKVLLPVQSSHQKLNENSPPREKC